MWNMIFAGYKIQMTNDFWTKNVEVLTIVFCQLQRGSKYLREQQRKTLRQFKWKNHISKKED